MLSENQPFEYRAALVNLEGGLDAIHESIARLRKVARRDADDPAVVRFETAVAEIGNNALTHGRVGTDRPVDYVLHWDGDTVVASLVDGGPPVELRWAHTMPPADSDAGRGIPLARALVDDLRYQRRGPINSWMLIKRL